MKRLAVCIAIIAAIIAAGIFSVDAVSEKNKKLYGRIDSVLEAYGAGGETAEAISELEDYFHGDYAPRLACIVDDDSLFEMSVSVNKLRAMYESGCDEFTAECEAIRAGAEKILKSEAPGIYRLL